MHILYLQQLLVLPGCVGINRSYELAKEWVKAGHKVTIVCSNATFPPNHSYYQSKKFPVFFQYEGIDIYVVNISYSHHMPFWRRVISFIIFFLKVWNLRHKLKGFDILLAYSAPLSVGELGRRLARFYNTPWIFEIADVWPDVPIGMGIIKNPFLIRWLNKRTKHIYDEATMITPFSEGMKAQIIRHHIPSDKIYVIHNGVNVAKRKYYSRTFSSTSDIQVIYAGTLGIANGLYQVIEAAELLSKWGRKDINFKFLGDGNQRKLLQKLVKEKALSNIQFLSQVSHQEVHRILNEADIGLISYAPYPVLEANGATKFFDYLANGLPIVINYEGWQAKYLLEYECGLYGKQGDIEIFANNILKLANSPELRKTFSQNGRQLVEKLFDRQLLAQKKLELMKKCL